MRWIVVVGALSGGRAYDVATTERGHAMAWNLRGMFYENCSCDAICPCTWSNLAHKATRDDYCRFALAFEVESGDVEGVDVGGRSFVLIADTPRGFDRWLDAERAPARDAPETAIFESTSCAGCHTVRGTTARGTKGPDLTHVGSRQFLAANTVDNTPAEMRKWIAHPQSLKPGALMPDVPLTTTQVRQLTRYLESLK